jgi:hypothetical protein
LLQTDPKQEGLVWVKYNLPSQNHLPIQGVQIRTTYGGTNSFLSTPHTGSPRRLIRSHGWGRYQAPPPSICVKLRHSLGFAFHAGLQDSSTPPGFVRVGLRRPPGYAARRAPPSAPGSSVCRVPPSAGLHHTFGIRPQLAVLLILARRSK